VVLHVRLQTNDCSWVSFFPSERRNKRWKGNGGERILLRVRSKWFQALSGDRIKRNPSLCTNATTLFTTSIWDTKHAFRRTSTPLHFTLPLNEYKMAERFCAWPPLFDVDCRAEQSGTPRLLQLNYVSKHLCSSSAPHIIVSDNRKLNPWNSRDNKMWKWLHNGGLNTKNDAIGCFRSPAISLLTWIQFSLGRCQL
jgi:hypothetical protein